MPRALDVLKVMEDVHKSHVAGTHLSSNKLHSQMEQNSREIENALLGEPQTK